MRAFSRFATYEDLRRPRREGLDWSALEPRQMLSGGGATGPAAQAPGLAAASITIQSLVADHSITALVVPAEDENPTIAGPGELFIVPSPISPVVVNLGPSSAPATNHLHLGIAISEEQPTEFTHFGQGSGERHPSMVLPRHDTPRMIVSYSLIDEVEAHAPKAEAPAPPKPAVAPPAVAPPAAHDAPEKPAAPPAPAPPAHVDPLFNSPGLESRSPLSSSVKEEGPNHLLEPIPSMGLPSWLGLAATAVGGSRFVWTRQDRAKSPWSPPAGRRRSLRARS